MMQKTTFMGHVISYDDPLANDGLRYLMHVIPPQEAKEFFNQAYLHGYIAFKDGAGYNFKLLHSGEEYELVKT